MSVSLIHAIQMRHARIHLVDTTALVMMVSLVMVSTAPTLMSVSIIHAIQMQHATTHMVDIIACVMMVSLVMVSTVQVRRMNLGSTRFCVCL